MAKRLSVAMHDTSNPCAPEHVLPAWFQAMTRLRLLAEIARRRPWTAPIERFYFAADLCVWCGGRQTMSIEHILPVSKGGPSHWTNYAAACRVCNGQRRNMSMLLFMLGRSRRRLAGPAGWKAYQRAWKRRHATVPHLRLYSPPCGDSV